MSFADLQNEDFKGVDLNEFEKQQEAIATFENERYQEHV